ncbi:hypothetical protein FLP41_04215 [Paracoccus marcusii]|uniref:hypothetical protein n=1 Tax=Paracoccus marcusii TaxID=59779 RepID=UPI002ED222E7|nr:hypothetical protein FLP41_04215 [Paracoccus marcusii]
MADALLEPSTQARMQNIEVLGSFSVLDPARLDAEGRRPLRRCPRHPPFRRWTIWARSCPSRIRTG